MLMETYILQVCNSTHHTKNKRPGRVTSSAAIRNAPWRTPKHTPNKHVKEGCETSGKYLRKLLKTWFMFYFWAQNDLEIRSLRPIFNTSLKAAKIDM